MSPCFNVQKALYFSHTACVAAPLFTLCLKPEPSLLWLVSWPALLWKTYTTHYRRVKTPRSIIGPLLWEVSKKIQNNENFPLAGKLSQTIFIVQHILWKLKHNVLFIKWKNHHNSKTAKCGSALLPPHFSFLSLLNAASFKAKNIFEKKSAVIESFFFFYGIISQLVKAANFSFWFRFRITSHYPQSYSGSSWTEEEWYIYANHLRKHIFQEF